MLLISQKAQHTYEALFLEGITLGSSHTARVNVCPGVSLPCFVHIQQKERGLKESCASTHFVRIQLSGGQQSVWCFQTGKK